MNVMKAEPIEKAETVRGFLDEASCALIEASCMLDTALKGLGIDLGYDGQDGNPKNLLDEARIVMEAAQFCMRATNALNGVLF